MVEVGFWALSQIARDYRKWTLEGIRPPRVTLNVSPLLLQHPDFLENLDQTIRSSGTGVVPLEVEITESVVMEDTAAIIARLDEIQCLGARVSMDNFGSGFSSLRHLARIPLDTLKIDRCFVAVMTESREDLAMVSGIIALAKCLDLRIIAEGVETREQQNLLRLLCCDEMQGTFIAAPLSVEQIADTLR